MPSCSESRLGTLAPDPEGSLRMTEVAEVAWDRYRKCVGLNESRGRRTNCSSELNNTSRLVWSPDT